MAGDNAYNPNTPFFPLMSATTFNVGTGGVKFDNSGFNITINQPLLHSGTAATDGGLTILGSGTTTLSRYRFDLQRHHDH